jgi:Uma2 family endonuclease
MGPSGTQESDVTAFDQRVLLRGVPWSQYEALLALRGESATPRISYLEGELELMTPSEGHESTKTVIGRLVEAYAEEIGVDLWSYGSWTLKSELKKRGAEPDECYVLRQPQTKGVPDLAIEVAWTRGGIDKLEIYRKLGVLEVWFWEKSGIEVFVLQAETYEPRSRSLVFPELDLGLGARLAAHPNHSQAVRELRAEVRKARGSE